ncbi:MAG: formate dehydrogenase accessory sulfurtransferase FdhD [Bacillota bacterium]
MITTQRQIHRYTRGNWEDPSDVVVREEVFLIYLDGHHIHTAFCLPADLDLLLIGHLFQSRFITELSDIETLEMDSTKKEAHVILRASRSKPDYPPVPSLPLEPFITPEIVLKYAENLAENHLFRKTGAVHCGLIVDSDKVVFMVEDTGRFNVLEKLTGFILRKKLNPSGLILFFSGRLTCGVMERVSRSGIRVVVSPAAPTSRGIETAIAEGVTAIGFARGERFNLYTHPERIVRE